MEKMVAFNYPDASSTGFNLQHNMALTITAWDILTISQNNFVRQAVKNAHLQY